MKISLHPAAEDDIEEAAAFYEKTGSPALAAKFVAEFKRVSQLLLEFPAFGSPRSRGRKGFSMTMFPYTVISNGEIIEDYPDDKYGPSCLIHGKTAGGRAIHVQCSYPSRQVMKVITVYEPDPERWIDFTVRRAS